MLRISKIVLTCILITYLSPVFTEATKTHTSVGEDNIPREFSRIQDVGGKWKSMESTLKKMFSMMYNGTLPFFFRVSNDLDISPTCKRDLRKMLKGIGQFKHWAIQMFDSFGKLPAGIGTGTFNELGDYDHCLEVNVPGSFQGQYCNLDFIIPMPKRRPYGKMKEIPEIASALQPDGYIALVSKYVNYLHHAKLRTAICVPSTCSKEELQKIVHSAAKELDLSTEPHIPNCEVMKKEVKFDRIEKIIMIILGILLLLVMTSTAFDVYLKTAPKKEENDKKNLSTPMKYFLCFSSYTNTKRLLKEDTKRDSITIFHGIRVLTTLWVILVHASFYFNFQAVGSMLFTKKAVGMMSLQVSANGFINVQIFFFMSGVLHAFRVMKMKEKVNIPKHLFRRIWRLAPPFLFVIACVILIRHLGSGPVWKETVTDALSERCRAKWWTNLLFINNFVKNKDVCLQWCWYIPADFQMYVISLLVVIPLKSRPRLALTTNVLIMIVAMAISAAFHLYYKLTPMLVLGFGDVEYYDYFLERGYFRTYLHFSSMCIGLAVGYFLSTRPSKLHIPLKISVPLWLASYSACLAVLLGVYKWNGGDVPSVGVAAMYACSSKIIWASALAWITIACTTGNGGILTKLLSLPIFVPLGRLCYMVYLIHSVIHFMYIGSTRSTIHMITRNIAYMFSATTFISFCCAFVFTLLFESPFMAMDKLMFDEKASERTKGSKALDDGKKEGMLMTNGNIDKDEDSGKKDD